ncbi:MAG: hypothetical protein ACJARE_000855 [Paracoccaceae bacterium]|jgi:hypothetical protein
MTGTEQDCGGDDIALAKGVPTAAKASTAALDDPARWQQLPPVPAIPPGSRTLVYLGPTLPRTEAEALLPGALICPPVRHGDLYGMIAADIDTVLIIDGVFHGDTPVWQREILALLAAGKQVVGASSMGALRALELAPFGMIGVGAVVAQYRDGVIEGDDEVALLHGDAEMEYMPLTLPLVDLRHGLALAQTADVITSAQAAAIASAMKAKGQGERSLRAALALAADLGVATDVLRRWIGPGADSLKACDARRALSALATPTGVATVAEIGQNPAALPPILGAGAGLQILLRAGFAHGGPGLRVGDALSRVADQAPATMARHRREESRRYFLKQWAELTGQGPSPDVVAGFAADWVDRAATTAGLAPSDWCRAAALMPGELPDLLHGRAVEAWVATRDAAALGLEPGPKNCPSVPLVLADWVRRRGITPPMGTEIDPQTVAAWLVQSGPAYFGHLDWDPTVAASRAMQAEGTMAALVLAQGAVSPKGQGGDA